MYINYRSCMFQEHITQRRKAGYYVLKLKDSIYEIPVQTENWTRDRNNHFLIFDFYQDGGVCINSNVCQGKLRLLWHDTRATELEHSMGVNILAKFHLKVDLGRRGTKVIDDQVARPVGELTQVSVDGSR